MPTSHTDVLVVGAGIIGLAHAMNAHWRGLSVRVLERDAEAVGASVRNFGHVCTTAQSRAMQPVAQASRRGWLRAAEEADVDAQTCGAVVLARTEAQLDVLRELAEERGAQVQLLSADEVREHLAGLGSSEILGGAFLRDDLRVNPRTAVGKLADFLNEQDDVEVLFRHNVLGFEQSQGGWRVTTNRGAFSAERVFVCVGHDVDYLFANIADNHGVERCRLSMGRVVLSSDVRITPAVLTGTSMARYGAFTEQPSAAALAEELRDTVPHLVDVDANVMSTQLPDGTLLVGDTHDIALAAPPFMKQAGFESVLSDLCANLNLRVGAVIERWQGVYATSAQHDILRATAAPNLEVISVTSGIGMTLSFGLAEQSFS